MKPVTRRLALALALAFAGTGALAQNKVNLGVAIPSADHGFTAGIVWWANEAKKELEAKYPDLKVTVKTAANAGEQANQLQDLMTATKINALVVFPFESAALTKPVEQVKKQGVYVTVVDRGLTDPSIQDAYVAGDNTAFGKVPAEFMAKALGGKGEGITPEHLFAAGYSACFAGATQFVAGQKKIHLPPEFSITAKVDLTMTDANQFQLQVALIANLPGIDKAVAQDLVETAHTVCPYSRAIHGNVDVKLEVA